MKGESVIELDGISGIGGETSPPAMATVAHCLLRDWLSNWRRFGLLSSLWRLLRSSRALLLPAEHARLGRLDIYRHYLSLSDGENYFHHLAYPHYLAKGLGFRQRVRFALRHYEFDAACFNGDYKRRVYSRRGLTLWEKQVAGAHFRFALSVAWRIPPEGDLCAALFIDGQRLHSMNFSWISDPHTGQIVPYITRNQGRWPHDPERLMQFEKAFPHNSPRYFCLAAVQGVARAVGAVRMLAVSGALQTCHCPEDDQQFAASYDAFWESQGGVPVPSWGYSLPIPFFSKPLSEVPTKHRKRAMMRRAHWTEIEQSATAVLQGCMVESMQGPAPAGRWQALATVPATREEAATQEAS